MKLYSVTINNWKSIQSTHITYEHLVVLIGENNTGKSQLMSAILFLLRPQENFPSGAIKNSDLVTELTGEFIDDNNHHIELSIIKEVGSDKLTFIQKTNYVNKSYGNWKELTLEQFRVRLESLTVLHISADSLDSTPEYKLFMTEFHKFAHKLATQNRNLAKTIATRLDNIGEPTRSNFRNALFESLIFFLDAATKNNIKSVNNLFIFYEQPEIFLHPQAERQLYDCLVKLSKLGIYVTLETQSSRFVGLKQFSAICLSRLEGDKLKYFQYKGNLFSGDEVKNFNMNYWINTDRSELFFAKKVILVEGQTDKMIIGYLGKTLNVFKYDYSIIECGSKSVIPQFIKLLNSFKIPYIAVYDKDNHKWRNEVEIHSSNLKNKQIQQSINKTFGDYVEFKNDIEEEIYEQDRERKNYKNKPFVALNLVMEDDFVIPKNLSEKIKHIYK